MDPADPKKERMSLLDKQPFCVVNLHPWRCIYITASVLVSIRTSVLCSYGDVNVNLVFFRMF